jgi:ArsR family transcriptional regulator, arsenate/arsenite/antimonite-responsive transcriptional repressor
MPLFQSGRDAGVARGRDATLTIAGSSVHPYRRISIRLIFVYMSPTLSTEAFLRIAKALADARRLAILERIAARGGAACQHLCEEFPVSQPTMSHHLRLLVQVGLIEMRREGQYAHYELREDVVHAYVATLERRLRCTPARSARSR